MHCGAEVTESSTNKQHHLSKKKGGSRSQTEPCSEVADLRQRLEFYKEYVFASPGAEEALARLLAENVQQQSEMR